MTGGADGVVSVVVPCYNAARYLDEALESVWAQGDPAVEVVVVDDGSTDDSAAVAARHGARVRVVAQANAGIAAARNHGVRAARGALLAFLDADDLWTPGALAARRSALAADPEAGIASGRVEQFVSPEVPAETAARLRFVTEPSAARVAGAMLVRRDVFARVGPFDPTLAVGETLDWVARADAAGVRTAALGAVVLRRRVHGANSVQKAAQLRADYLRVLRRAVGRQRGDAGASA